jgi:hypothetical protein
MRVLTLTVIDIGQLRFWQERGVKMALTEVKSSSPAFDPARSAKSFHDSGLPHDALGRLPLLHREAGHTLSLSRFLARSPAACVALMLTGAGALLWAGSSDGGTLKADFAWAALVLLGVIAMTRNFVRGYARSLRRVPLDEAAADLRMLLLYTGVAWGTGAFLVMPGLPAPALVFSFAAAPSVVLTLLLPDFRGALAFVAPTSLITAGAALLGAWPLDSWVATAIIITGAAMIISMLRRAMRPSALPRPVLQ